MGYSLVALENKLLDMYPEIQQNGLSPRLRYDEEKEQWYVTLKKGAGEFTACMRKDDADACMDNQYCESFGKEVREIIKKLTA
jgi:hypothetical protein